MRIGSITTWYLDFKGIIKIEHVSTSTVLDGISTISLSLKCLYLSVELGRSQDTLLILLLLDEKNPNDEKNKLGKEKLDQ